MLNDKVLASFASAIEEMEKDAGPTALVRGAIRGSGTIAKSVGAFLAHPNITLRAAQTAGAGKSVFKHGRKAFDLLRAGDKAGAGKVVSKNLPNILHNVEKAKKSGTDLLARLTGKGKVTPTVFERTWKGAKAGATGVAAAGAIGTGALAYGALHRPPTSDFTSLTRD